MKTIELFAGTGSFSRVGSHLGHQTFMTDASWIDGQDLIADVRTLRAEHFPYSPDLLWASPPCEGFSVAAIGRNWTPPPGHLPKTDTARLAVELIRHTWRLIDELQPKWWFIENPRGKLRKLTVIERAPIRKTVSYCQYGDTRMKPTDIWTNAAWWQPRPMCRNGDPCHEAAPRGAKTGTQGISGYKQRSRIPCGIFYEMFDQLCQLRQAA